MQVWSCKGERQEYKCRDGEKGEIAEPPFKSDTTGPRDTNEENSTLVAEWKQEGCLFGTIYAQKGKCLCLWLI